jgi:hypothetical protein
LRFQFILKRKLISFHEYLGVKLCDRVELRGLLDFPSPVEMRSLQ